MKILFNQGTPVPLRKYLAQYDIETAYERGWNDISNGDLLTVAESAGFDVLVTTDQNLRYQQNLTSRQIIIVVLLTASWPRIKNHLAIICSRIDDAAQMRSGSYHEIPIP